jgi:hypothetical protein
MALTARAADYAVRAMRKGRFEWVRKWILNDWMSEWVNNFEFWMTEWLNNFESW